MRPVTAYTSAYVAEQTGWCNEQINVRITQAHWWAGKLDAQDATAGPSGGGNHLAVLPIDAARALGPHMNDVYI